MDNSDWKCYGMDPRQGLYICLNNPKLYNKILRMFLDGAYDKRAEKAFLAKDYSEMFEAIHDIKGASANAGLYVLNELATPLVELLRKDVVAEDTIARMYQELKISYVRAIEGIERYLEQQSR